MSQKCVGECSNCGSLVYVPMFFYSIHPPQPQCSGCGCKAKSQVPVLPMVNPPKETPKGSSQDKEISELQKAVEKHRQQVLPFVPLSPQQKSEVQEKIEETRKIVMEIQKEQIATEAQTLENEKMAAMEKAIDRLESMMVLVAKSLKEIKDQLPPVPEEKEETENADGEEESEPTAKSPKQFLRDGHF